MNLCEHFNRFGDIQRNELPGDKFAKRDKFPDYTNLMDQIDNIASDTSKIKKRVISRTFDKIELFVLEMVTNPKNPGVFIISGEQGGDWLSPSVLMNFINKILKHDSDLAELNRYYNFYFAPLANPDGYIYSWAKVSNLKAIISESAYKFTLLEANNIIEYHIYIKSSK